MDLATGGPPDASLLTVTLGYAQALQESMAEMHLQVRDILRLAGQAMEQLQDQHAGDACYAVGDKVWLHNPRRKKGLYAKLRSPWEDSCTVLKWLSDIAYQIRR